MHIVLATDDNFVQHCTVAILSILQHNKAVLFHILTEGLSQENSDYMSGLVDSTDSQLTIHVVPSDIVHYFPMSSLASNHISLATYYRLFITSLLPAEINKVIYLDCDMVIRGSLDELWNVDLSEYALGAVYQFFEWSDHNDCWNRLQIPREAGYFNAGCLLMNLDYLRRVNFQQLAVDYIHANQKRIISHDQDVLNALFHDQTKALDCRWNYLSLFLSDRLKPSDFPERCHYVEEKREPGFEPVIIHFVSKPKPWHYGCKNPYVSEYYHYLRQTKWRDFQPHFSWKVYMTNVLIPSVKLFVKRLDFLGITDKRHLKQVRKQYME